MVPEITVAEAVVVAHAVEVRRDVVAAKDRTEHNTRLLLKIFPAVAIGHNWKTSWDEQVKFATSTLTTEWVAVAVKFVLAAAKLCTRQKMNSTDTISMERELKLSSRRMVHDRHHQTEVDLVVDLGQDLDHEADREVDDQDHEVEIVEEVAVEAEVVADDLEADLRQIAKTTNS